MVATLCVGVCIDRGEVVGRRSMVGFSRGSRISWAVVDVCRALTAVYFRSDRLCD